MREQRRERLRGGTNFPSTCPKSTTVASATTLTDADKNVPGFLKHLIQHSMFHPLYFTAVQRRILQAVYQCFNRIICVKVFMRMVLRQSESFPLIFIRLMDISGSHTNVGTLLDNVTLKYHKLIQQLPRWSWKYSCGTGSTLGQKPNKKYFHPYKNQIHLKAKQS